MSRRWRELQLQRTTKKPFNRKQGRKQKEKIEITNCFSQTLKLFNFNNTSQKVSPTWRNAFKTCPIKFLHPEYAKNACSSTRRPTQKRRAKNSNIPHLEFLFVALIAIAERNKAKEERHTSVQFLSTQWGSKHSGKNLCGVYLNGCQVGRQKGPWSQSCSQGPISIS